MYHPTKEQIGSLSKLLTFLAGANIKWHKIELSGDIIVIKAEPPKGEIDIRVLEIYSDGGFDDDGFREQIQKID